MAAVPPSSGRDILSAAAAEASATQGKGSIGLSKGCPLLNEELLPPLSVPLPDVAPWQPGRPARRANSTHFFMYVPRMESDADLHSLRAVIRASQFPADPAACNRTLILWDDALTAGLGYSARLIALALLVAVQEHRVLVMPDHRTRRWCGRPPYTLGCYYEPITHCSAPNSSGTPKWSTRGSSDGLEHRQSTEYSSPHVRMSTSQVHRSVFWYKFHPPNTLWSATHDLLYRPRLWVRDAAHCIMRAGGLHGGNYVVVHARFSAEKKKERGGGLPPLSAYLPLTVCMYVCM